MRLASVAECREIDLRSQKAGGVDEAERLMERAGEHAALKILEISSEILKGQSELAADIAVVCGGGGNGGDGLVVARYLHAAGVSVNVVLTDPQSRHELVRKNLERLSALGIAPENLSEHSLSKIQNSIIVVDAVFGIGLSRPPSGGALEAIQAINSSRGLRVCLDLPSGLDGDSGLPLGEAVMSDLTLSFGIAKVGMALNEGPRHVGHLEVLDIGFPKEIVNQVAVSIIGFDRKFATKLLPRRSPTSNKSSHGRAMIIAGSPGMMGAAILCGSAAARTGAGYVTIGSSGETLTVLKEFPEFLTLETSEIEFGESPKWTASAIGPGLGPDADDLLRKMISAKNSPAVVDADALTALSRGKFELPLSDKWILTPHAGELSRLLSVDAKKIESDRVHYARVAAKKYGCVVLLKGFRTVVSHGSKCAVILSGNSALAKAGSGDVLTGIITGFLSQGVSSFEAACLGAYVHGRIADEWLHAKRDILSLQPSDLVAVLPSMLKRIRAGEIS